MIRHALPLNVGSTATIPRARVYDFNLQWPRCRCQLCIRVRGGHRGGGGAAQAAWALLRRNGIVPTQIQAGSDIGGSNGGSGSGSGGAGGSAGPETEDLKAFVDLSEKPNIVKILKKVGMGSKGTQEAVVW